VDENKPAKVSLLPDNLPKGAKFGNEPKSTAPGNQSSPARGGTSSGGSGSNPGGSSNSGGGKGNNTGGSGNNSGGGSKQ